MNKREKRLVIESMAILDAIWSHHLDGSDLAIDEHELFHLVFNQVLKRLKSALSYKKNRLAVSKHECDLCGLTTKNGGGCIHCGTFRWQLDIKNLAHDAGWSKSK